MQQIRQPEKAEKEKRGTESLKKEKASGKTRLVEAAGAALLPGPRPGLCPGSGTLLDGVCSRSGSSHSGGSAGALRPRSASGLRVPRLRAAPGLRMLLRGGVPGPGRFGSRALRGGLLPGRGCSSMGALRAGLRAPRGAPGTGVSGWARRPCVPGAARSQGRRRAAGKSGTLPGAEEAAAGGGAPGSRELAGRGRWPGDPRGQEGALLGGSYTPPGRRGRRDQSQVRRLSALAWRRDSICAWGKGLGPAGDTTEAEESSQRHRAAPRGQPKVRRTCGSSPGVLAPS